jgi:Ca2+-binding EF-hand superfamily protein
LYNIFICEYLHCLTFLLVPAESIKQLSKEFSKVSDRKGQVSKENFKKIVKKVYGSDNSTLITTVFKMFDTDGSGYSTMTLLMFFIIVLPQICVSMSIIVE